MRVAAAAVVIAVCLVAAELLASTALLYQHRMNGDVYDGRGGLSLTALGERLLEKAGWIEPRAEGRFEFKTEVTPGEFFRSDPYFGYSANPGTFTHVYKRRRYGEDSWEKLPVKVTINADGSRWTGDRGARPATSTLYVLGDSWMFGNGVNDEQTFSYLVQSARPDLDVKLYALGGYGLTQAYLRFQLLKDRIGPSDAIVIGYGDYLDGRTVAAPSWLRIVRDWSAERDPWWRPKQIPKAQLYSDGRIGVSLVDQDCTRNRDYCNAADPSPDEVAATSAAVVNAIAAATPAKVSVLLVRGADDNAMLRHLDKRVHVIRARPKDFDQFVQDDVSGFDSHPGPYWHYAVSRRLLGQLR